MTKFVPGSKLLQVFIEVKNPSWPGHPAFFTENDYRFFLDCLRQAKLKCVCRICAYVPMTNHFHLLVKPSQAGDLGRCKAWGEGMFGISNETYHRSGTAI